MSFDMVQITLPENGVFGNFPPSVTSSYRKPDFAGTTGMTSDMPTYQDQSIVDECIGDDVTREGKRCAIGVS